MECPISQLGFNIMTWAMLGGWVIATVLLFKLAAQTNKTKSAEAYAAQWMSLQDGTLGTALLSMLATQQVQCAAWSYGRFTITGDGVSATGTPAKAVAEMAAMLEARKIARRLSGDHN